MLFKLIRRVDRATVLDKNRGIAFYNYFLCATVLDARPAARSRSWRVVRSSRAMDAQERLRILIPSPPPPPLVLSGHAASLIPY